MSILDGYFGKQRRIDILWVMRRLGLISAPVYDEAVRTAVGFKRK
jgi:hypothetical protein